jgi:PAS domain-containing protein
MFLRRKFSSGFSRAVNRLLRSLSGIRHATGILLTPDAATTMEKLDAALSNMSHGLCMFGPDNRLLLWNDRYVKMYKLAPDRLRVGCTLDEMLEARKAAGTTYRDLGQYGSKLLMAMTTRSPDNLVAQLDDGRIVNVFRTGRRKTAAGFRPTRTSSSARKTRQGLRIWRAVRSASVHRLFGL